MNVGSVQSIFRYPVKSMAGETLQAAQLETRGIPGDRAWAVRDEERGGIRGAKRFPALMRCAARYEAEPAKDGSTTATVTFPDGKSMAIDDAGTPSALSALVDGNVSVWPLMPAEMLDHYRRGPPLLEDMDAEMRRVFGRTADEPLPEIASFPAELMEYESPPGTYFDAFPLLVMTCQGLRHLQALAAEHEFDVRRFRPNILIDASDSQLAFPEREWVGKTLRIGGASVEITMGCPRCSMTTHGFDNLPKDPGIMRTLVKEANGELGVYAKVSTAGGIALGDAAALV